MGSVNTATRRRSNSLHPNKYDELLNCSHTSTISTVLPDPRSPVSGNDPPRSPIKVKTKRNKVSAWFRESVNGMMTIRRTRSETLPPKNEDPKCQKRLTLPVCRRSVISEQFTSVNPSNTNQKILNGNNCCTNHHDEEEFGELIDFSPNKHNMENRIGDLLDFEQVEHKLDELCEPAPLSLASNWQLDV
ncbi:hypothetical protein ACOME3_002131 [Neoechinorhynchus agilis]